MLYSRVLKKIILLVLLIYSSAIFSIDIEFISAPETGVELGLGWDSATSTIIPNRCVKFAPIQEGGQVLNLDLQEASDSSELANNLNISSSLSIKGMVGSASARASLSRNTNVKSTSNTFSVRATVQNGIMFAGPTKRLPDRRYAFSTTENRTFPNWVKDEIPATQENLSVDLQPWASSIINKAGDNDNPERKFRQQCGDYFISAINSGAEVLAVITFETEEEATKAAISAAITGSYSIASGGASIDLDTDKKAQSSKLKVSYTQIGGARGEIPTTNADLKRKLSVLAAEAATAPMFYAIGITAYADLPSWSGSEGPVKEADKLNKLLSQRDLEMFTLYNTLESILSAPDEYNIDNDLLPPRRYLLAELQDKVLRIWQSIVEFQAERQPYEEDILSGALNANPAKVIEAGTKLAKLNFYKNNNTGSSDYDTVQNNVIEELQAMDVPAMRLYLPLPILNPVIENNSTNVVDYYIGQQAKRACRRSPDNVNCLSNDVLRLLEDKVMPNYHRLTDLHGRKGYLFSGNGLSKGCLHVTPKYDETEIKKLSKNSLDFKAQGCTLFEFNKADNGHYRIKKDNLFLSRLGQEISLAEENTNVYLDWFIEYDNLLGQAPHGETELSDQCLVSMGTKEESKQLADVISCSEKSDENIGWFFMPDELFPFTPLEQ